MTDELVFCVDGGGTRSRARLYDRRGETVAQALDGPCNPATDLPRAVASVAGLWGQCAAAIGRRADDLAGVTFAAGVAGTFFDSGAAFLAAGPPFPRRLAMSDGYAALIGAGAGAPCSLLIAGTGVAGHRLYPDGQSIQRDAWGWVGGDRGGGSWIGRAALRHALAALDGVVAHDGLSRAVLAAIGGVAALREGWTSGLGPDRLGALAPVAFEQAAAGDPAARRLLERAAARLAALIGVIADAETPLYAAGGLVAPLLPWLARETDIPILSPKSDALAGCRLVAAGLAPIERALLFGEAPTPLPASRLRL